MSVCPHGEKHFPTTSQRKTNSPKPSLDYILQMPEEQLQKPA